MFSINSDFNKIFKAICYKTRTDILQELARDNNLTLTKLSKKFKMKISTLEFHVQKLKDVGVIKSKRKDGSVLLIFNRQKIEKAITGLKKVIA